MLFMRDLRPAKPPPPYTNCAMDNGSPAISSATSSAGTAVDFDATNERELCKGLRVAFVGSDDSRELSLGRPCAELEVFGRSFDGLALFVGGRSRADPGREVPPLPRLPVVLNGSSRRGGISSSSVSGMVNEAVDETADDGRISPEVLKGSTLDGGISFSQLSWRKDVADVIDRAVEGRGSMASEVGLEECEWASTVGQPRCGGTFRPAWPKPNPDSEGWREFPSSSRVTSRLTPPSADVSSVSRSALC